MRLPGVGLYRWSDRSDAVTAIPEPSVPDAATVDTFHRSVLPMVLQTRGAQVLHASAVLVPDGVVALCARSRTGKSTLAYALARELGCSLWADDAVAFEPAPGGTVSAVPLPFALKLRDGAAAHFGLDGPSPASPPERPAPLRALFALERAESLSRPAVRRLTASRAFTALLEHAYCFDVEHAPMRELMVDAYLELSARVPSFELRFPSGFEGLPLTVEAVAGALRREAA